MNIAKRVGALEGRAGDGGFEKAHRILCNIGQTKDEALDAYGRDKIGSNDLVVVRTFISPAYLGKGLGQ